MKKLRRYHVPREAMGIGYEEWASQVLKELSPNEPQPQQPKPPLTYHAPEPLSALVPLLVFLLILVCVSFLVPSLYGGKLTAEEIMSRAFR
jgi:hypothetical protein